MRGSDLEFILGGLQRKGAWCSVAGEVVEASQLDSSNGMA